VQDLERDGGRCLDLAPDHRVGGLSGILCEGRAIEHV
jgi:hypothetical protein